MLGRVPKRIDILTRISGVSFRRAWKTRVYATLDARRRVPIIGRAELIRAKLAAARPQDLADADALMKFEVEERTPRRRARGAAAR
ncbi:MAG: hypothetical protein IPM35_37390 [Myxococcales bacterium]|nr:hypothetical protein [Myxococcales bacterium]